MLSGMGMYSLDQAVNSMLSGMGMYSLDQAVNSMLSGMGMYSLDQAVNSMLSGMGMYSLDHCWTVVTASPPRFLVPFTPFNVHLFYQLTVYLQTQRMRWFFRVVYFLEWTGLITRHFPDSTTGTVVRWY